MRFAGQALRVAARERPPLPPRARRARPPDPHLAAVGLLTLRVDARGVARLRAPTDPEATPAPADLERLAAELRGAGRADDTPERATARALVGALCLYCRLRRGAGERRALRLVVASPFWTSAFRRNFSVWRRRGWRTAAGAPLRNADLLRQIDLLRRELPVSAALATLI